MSSSNYFLSGELITGGESFAWLSNNLPSANAPISIASAYVKSQAIKEILQYCGQKGRFLARWRLHDLIAGASDIEVYSQLVDIGWDFYISQNFHGKLYQLPGVGILVGSVNATLSGLSIYRQGNTEVSTIVENNIKNQELIDALFTDAIKVTPELFKQLKVFYDSAVAKKDTLSKDIDLVWPAEIKKSLWINKVKKLFTSDCFRTKSGVSDNPDYLSQDLSLLGLSSLDNISAEQVSQAISESKIYNWLIAVCLESPNGIFYGELTAKLHNDLLDDPSPYRSSIKDLLSNLLSWVETYKSTEISISRPNYSQKIELKR
jgi:hypothetical protein